MQIEATAGTLAGALNMLTTAIECAGKIPPSIPALRAVTLNAELGRLRASANVLDYHLAAALDVTVHEAGEAAVPCEVLAGICAGLPEDADVDIRSSDEHGCVVLCCGRSRYRLPVIPLADMPLALDIGNALGTVALDGTAALRQFDQVKWAAADDATRYYLNGVFLHHLDGALASVATNGHRLARVVAQTDSALADDRGLIVPLTTVKLIVKLLKKTKPDRVTLARSEKLFAIETAEFTLTSKLVDATYPDYRRLISSPGNGTARATLDRDAVISAVKRLTATASTLNKDARAVRFRWDDGTDQITLDLADIATDAIDADVVGDGGASFKLGLAYLTELLDELPSSTVRFCHAGDGAPVFIDDPSDPSVLLLQMPCMT